MTEFAILLASVGGFIAMVGWTYYNVVRPDISGVHKTVISWMIVSGIIMIAISILLALVIG